MQPGTRLGHYEIIEQLGAGGMGEVYRAHDTNLKRDVAIKVLPQELSADPDRLARLEREAHVLAALNHSNIAAIYGLEDEGDQRFIVMEVVEGETLAEKIARSGRIEVDEALEIARQIAEALEAAHEKGIVHRDLKPANVMLTPHGKVKVLDFGLAKSTDAVVGSSDTDLSQSPTLVVEGTQTGVILGTAAYMSPEQARGKPLDKRTDIWSFGCVLYEMMTATRAFGRETMVDTLSAILEHEPEWENLPGDTLAGVRTLLVRTLQKDAHRRLRDIGDARLEMEDALARLGRPPAPRPGWGRSTVAPSASGPDTGRIDSIAVLPLTNLSGDVEQEYFSDGMTEALITNLAKIRALKVISRTSVMRYKGSDKPLPEIARELGVEAIVEGSVLRAGDEVRITAQLIHAPSDTHLWAESYARDLTNILSLQSEVARAVAHEVEATLTPREEAQLAGKETVNPAAYQTYLKGRYFWNQRGPGLEKSIELFEQALFEDANYAPAYAGLADAYALVGFYGYSPPREVMPKAKDAARKALEIDEGLAEAHCSLGYIHTIFDWEWETARREFQRALELNPNYGPARYWYSVCLWFSGHFEESIAEVRRGLETDPLDVYMHVQLGCALLAAEKYAQASEPLLQALELEPDSASARSILGIAYYFQSRIEDAVREIQRAIDVSHRDQWSVGSLGVVYAATGDRTRAEEILVELEGRAQNEYIHASWIAAIYALLDEKDEAFEWLEKAYNERAPLVASCALKTWPGWLYNNLRADSRFQDLLRRLGLDDGE